MSDSLRGWLRQIGRPDDDGEAEEEVSLWDELDELRLQRVERGDAKWSPQGAGALERLVRLRRDGTVGRRG